MTISRARAARNAIEKINRLDSREELVRVELTLMGGGDWLWAIETRLTYGPGVEGSLDDGHGRCDAAEALIEGYDSWPRPRPPVEASPHDVPNQTTVHADGRPTSEPDPRPHEPGCELPPLHTGQCGLTEPSEPERVVAAALADDRAALDDLTEDELTARLGPADDDDDEPERPAIIGATPEEVRRRIEAGRAAAASTLDDLPF